MSLPTCGARDIRENADGELAGVGCLYEIDCFLHLPLQLNRDSAVSLAQNAAFISHSQPVAKDIFPINQEPDQGCRRALQPLFARIKRIRQKGKEMNRAVSNLIAVAERSEKGFSDLPPGAVNDDIEIELAQFGYAIARSDRLWIGGYRIHTPESVQAGNYRPYVPPSLFTCAASRFAHVPDARDINVETITEERGELRSN